MKTKYLITALIISLGLNIYFFNKIILRKINLYLYKEPKVNVSEHLINPKKVTYSMNRQGIYKELYLKPNATIFIGDSHIQLYPINDFFQPNEVVNRGINSDVSLGVLLRLDQILATNPNKIFIEIGVNDLLNGLPTIQVVNNYKKIIAKIKNQSPKTNIYILSILPTGWYISNTDQPVETAILKVNQELAAFENDQIVFINVYDLLVDDIGSLNIKYDSGDRLHLNYAGYKVITDELKKHIK